MANFGDKDRTIITYLRANVAAVSPGAAEYSWGNWEMG